MNMSVQTVTPSSAYTDEVNDTNCIEKSGEKQMAESSKTLKQLETRGEEDVQTNIISFCAFVVAKPKLSFGKSPNVSSVMQLLGVYIVNVCYDYNKCSVAQRAL